MGLPNLTTVQVLTFSLVRPNLSAPGGERDWQLLRFGTGNIIREMLNLNLKGHSLLSAEVLEYSDQEFFIIFMGVPTQDEQKQEFIIEISNAMLENILQYMKLSVLAGLGSVRDGYHQLIDSYLESRTAVETAEMNEWNRVYAFTSISLAEPDKSVSMDTVRYLHDAIFQKQWQQAYDQWKQLRNEMARSKESLSVSKGVCSGILSVLWTASFTIETQVETTNHGLEDILLQLTRFGSVSTMLEWMNDTVARMVAQIQEEQGGKKSHALVDRVIKDYIEKCYHEDISLERIAASLHVNRNYLSQLFKRVTGEPFVTYFNKFRIRKAIELISTGKYMVYEISERVGFQNPTYFSQVFKSITGYSPSEYDGKPANKGVLRL
ncbi:YesN/AraC family two-component response regulator [Paenibacillus sp. DS2015]